MRRVVVTGLGAITPLGVGAANSWQRLVEGRCGVISLQGLPEFEGMPSQVAATIPAGNASTGGWNSREWLSTSDERRMAKFVQYAVAAAEEALTDAEWKPTAEHDRERTGVCIGSGIGNLEDIYTASQAFAKGGYEKVNPLIVPRLLINLAAGHVMMKYGFRGPNHAVSTACTTGAHSLGDASRFIAFNDADVMIAGGAESCIHVLSFAGFCRLNSLAKAWNDTPHLASRPFDRDRGGFVIGEGAGMVVLEELQHAIDRRANIYAELVGYGLSSDAHHMTAPPRDGSGAYLAMKRALMHAKIEPRDVDYVNAHATSTPLGDAAENKAIRALLLGEKGRRKAEEVNISSSKGATGHLLGAAGAVEAIFTIRALHENIIPPTLNLDNPGNPAEDFDCNYVPHRAQDMRVDVAITNSFGFGGTNASLCFAKVK